MKALSTAFPLAAILALTIGCGGSDSDRPKFGVVALAEGGISIVDPVTQSVGAPALVGELGTAGGGRFDVAIAPGGDTTLVSNFGDSLVYFINTTDTTNPVVTNSVDIGFFAEDIAITRDGKFALVTDGGFSPTVAVVDMATQTLLNTYTSEAIVVDDTTDPVTTYTPNFNAISISPDGKTVLAADYFYGAVVALTLDATGTLTYGSYVSLLPDATKPGQLFRPVNITIAPNGKTAVAAVTGYTNEEDPENTFEVLGFPTVKITSPGVISLGNYNVTTRSLKASQTAVFSPSGSKVYVYCTPVVPTPAPTTEPGNVIVELDIAAGGVLTDAGKVTELGFIGRSQLFGVDTMALDRSGRYLYVSNMTLSGAKSELEVLDLHRPEFIKTLPFADIDIDEDGTGEATLPTGICFAP
ncbi:MAG: Lactonase, 7-bladed beta-propeller [Holophagaceae bacterium]|nr:Lactonase, 7-bladed beta-propeller [Holophagaceae bacterium]